MCNFKKNKNSYGKIKKKLDLEKSYSTKFSKTQFENFNSRQITEQYGDNTVKNIKK